MDVATPILLCVLGTALSLLQWLLLVTLTFDFMS